MKAGLVGEMTSQPICNSAVALLPPSSLLLTLIGASVPCEGALREFAKRYFSLIEKGRSQIDFRIEMGRPIKSSALSKE